ncbi:MAG: S4 domain-containing protein, partial [Limnobacter sp.]|nr:S4 domain-containing protein [Limnobacter sp.]
MKKPPRPTNRNRTTPKPAGNKPAARKGPVQARTSRTKPASGAAPRRSRVTGTRTIDELDPTVPQRLSKIMAAKGLCSRREADYLIEKGWVRVNGNPVNELGTKILPTATIDLDSRAKNNLSKQVTILYHKPIGVVSGQPEGRYKAAMEMIGNDNQYDQKSATPFSGAMLKGLAPAGRLDIDSTGLLVLTQDGR